MPAAGAEEQDAIVARAEQILLSCERLTAEIRAAQLRASRLRQAILAKAFSGQLAPQDPNDEHASVLLERIRPDEKAVELN